MRLPLFARISAPPFIKHHFNLLDVYAFGTYDVRWYEFHGNLLSS
jgi:hypothetical protein